MWGLITTVFLGLYGLMSYYIGHRGWYSLGRPASRLYRWIYFAFFILLILFFPVAELGEDILPASIAPWLTIWGGYSMVAVSYLFLLLLLIDILRLIDRRVSYIPTAIKEHKKTPLTVGIIVLIFVFLTVVYGGWNARNPIVKEYDISVHKDAGDLEQLRITMISDIHYGPIIDTRRLDRMLDITEELRPDIILLAGDITDGSLPEGESQKLAEVLGQMQAPYGTFVVPGNHDRDLRNEGSELVRYLQEAGIPVLKDEYIAIVNDSFYLIGRDDPNRRNERGRMELVDIMKGIDPSKPLILLDHQPIDLENAKQNGIDLQLSGHTHRGQIFPAQLITGRIYELDWGLLKKDEYHLIVSSGYGTWGPPLRIGNNPEVVSITMTFH
jgi:predicted MPP superfamily phosphohydrolase